MNTVFFKNLGMIDFKEAWGVQEQILGSIIDDKKNKNPTKSYLLFCQHPHVYTLGKSGKKPMNPHKEKLNRILLIGAYLKTT